MENFLTHCPSPSPSQFSWGLLYLCFCGTGVFKQSLLQFEPLSQPCFGMGLFEIGSLELFAQAGLEPRSSWSLPPEYLGYRCQPLAPSNSRGLGGAYLLVLTMRNSSLCTWLRSHTPLTFLTASLSASRVTLLGSKILGYKVHLEAQKTMTSQGNIEQKEQHWVLESQYPTSNYTTEP
jgi:hypothetical protein